MSKEYWLIHYNYTPAGCKTISRNAAISEHPADFIARTAKLMGCDKPVIIMDWFNVDVMVPIDQARYNNVKIINPHQGCYVGIKDEDAAKEE